MTYLTKLCYINSILFKYLYKNHKGLESRYLQYDNTYHFILNYIQLVLRLNYIRKLHTQLFDTRSQLFP